MWGAGGQLRCGCTSGGREAARSPRVGVLRGASGEPGRFSGTYPPGAGLALALSLLAGGCPAATATWRQAGGGAGGWPPGPNPSGHPPPRACPAYGLWCQDCTLTTNSSHCTPKQCQPSDTVCASVRITDPSSSKPGPAGGRGSAGGATGPAVGQREAPVWPWPLRALPMPWGSTGG